MESTSKKLPMLAVRVIPHDEQRYNTLGDYQEKDGVILFTISSYNNPVYEYIVLMHELHEWFLCWLKGVKLEDIDKFDMEHPELTDPGVDDRAPYKFAHMKALELEGFLADSLGLSLDDCDKFNEIDAKLIACRALRELDEKKPAELHFFSCPERL